jgi:hypothetical protein
MAPPRHVRFQEPREGSSLSECEDAAAADPERGRYAIADGAGESSHAGLWARMLVEGFVQEATHPWPAWIAPLQARWSEATRRPEGEPLPWFLDSRDQRGAYSTFVGLSLGEESFHAIAIGDSCLFHVSDDEMTPFPLTSSNQFGNTPVLIGSKEPVEQVPLRQARQEVGSCRPGDQMWLMTDALARWFLQRHEAGEKPWHLLLELSQGTEAGFSQWVTRLRACRQLRDDDATLLGVLL